MEVAGLSKNVGTCLPNSRVSHPRRP